MKKRIFCSVVLSAVISCFVSTGWAVNSGAHIYVTEQVYGSADVDLLYGSIAPDLSLYVPVPEEWVAGFEDTHYNYIDLWPQGWTTPWKRFAMGWMLHNEEWGADWYSHISYPKGPFGNGYVVDKASILSGVILTLNPGLEPDLAMEIAHNAIEFAIDLLIQENLDPALGDKLNTVVLSRSDEDIRRLFNILVAKNKATDQVTLYQSETFFRYLVFEYSQALKNSSIGNMGPLAEAGSDLAFVLYGIDIPPDQVQGLLLGAVDLCAGDFQEFLDDTIDGIKVELGIQ